MKKTALIVAVVLLCVLAFTACGGSRSGGKLTYPDYGYADAESDSWLQIGDEEKTIEIEWYIDSSSFSFNPKIVDLIERKTKVKIIFRQPVTDDGSGLGTMLAGDMLPDVLTITNDNTRVKLENSNRVYPLNILAEKYAPTLLGRIDDSQYNYFKNADGNIYTLANNFYTDADSESYEGMGKALLSNTNFVARSDYLYAFLEHKYNVSRADPDFLTNAYTHTTTPSGFLEMCLWVKQNYGLTNSNPTVLLDFFSTTEGSGAINRIAEYFNTGQEDSQGNLLVRETQPEFKEAMLFLNTLYRSNLITNGNLSANSSSIGQYIANALPFVCMVAPQNYIGNFATAAIGKSAEYVPIVITNEAGDAPMLRSLAGYGYRKTLITSQCKRVDRVIKMIDYLVSEESNREFYYGVENQNYTVVAQPGQTVDGVTYPYGCYEWTDDTWAFIQQGSSTSENYLVRMTSLLSNPMYPRMTTKNPEALNTYKDYLLYNMKAAMKPYVYNKAIMDYTLDTTDQTYESNVDRLNNINLLWYSNYTKIISATSQAAAENLIDSTIATAKVYGQEALYAFQNKCFTAYKLRFGIDGCAYPSNQSDYTAPAVTLMGDTSQKIKIPSNVTVKA